MLAWETWQFSLNITVPNLLLLLLGVLLRFIRIIDDHFCDKAMRLLFTTAIPCMLFVSLASYPIHFQQHLTLILFAIFATVGMFILLEIAAKYWISNINERGIFVQGGFRGNTAVVGIAYATSVYGLPGISAASIYIAVTVILYNLLSIITLTRSLAQTQSPHILHYLAKILTNPIIIAIVAGICYTHYFSVVPFMLQKTGKLLSELVLPLALLCIGASLNFRSLIMPSKVASSAVLVKIILLPLLTTLAGWLTGFRGIPLGVIFLFSATPTATVSYVMVRALGGNTTLAANIIVMSTLGSLVATSIGLSVLKTLAVI